MGTNRVRKIVMREAVMIVVVLCLAVAAQAAERPKRAKSAEAPPAAAAPVTPISILSIIPAQAEPGSKVMLFGSGFGGSASVFLGSIEIAARITDGKQAEFTIPAQLEPGLYALYLKRGDGVNGRPYNFTVLPLRPVLSGLSPDRISFCAQGKEREVVAQGRNFTENSQLIFDGAAISRQLVSPDTITFTVPQVQGGLHQVMIKNAADNSSVPQGLIVETRPEITQVRVGSEFVNFYEVLIEGRNFTRESTLFVEGQRIGGRSGQDMGDREKLVFVDCSHLIYQRYPYSPVIKDFQIQIVNQGGEGSQFVTVTAP